MPHSKLSRIHHILKVPQVRPNLKVTYVRQIVNVPPVSYTCEIHRASNTFHAFSVPPVWGYIK